MESVHKWEIKRNRPATKTTKGSFTFAEHFSVFKAEVSNLTTIPSDPSTKVNMPLIEKLNRLDILAWAGIAKDYCLANSFYDFMIELSGGDKATMAEIGKKMVFIEDGTAAVGMVKELSDNLDKFMKDNNVTTVKANDFLR
jgi:hypothetical protein